MSSRQISLITIGDELLLGLRENSHLVTVGQQLKLHGAELAECLTIRDQPEEILSAFQQSIKNSDVIISTGGLGPTTDDCTRAVIAKLVDQPLVRNHEAEVHIADILEKKGRSPTSTSLSQADIPKGAMILHNANGTAPGIYIKYHAKHIFLLPGPPREMNPILEEQVIPMLKQLDYSDSSTFSIIAKIIELGESEVQELVHSIQEQLETHPQIAYCAHQGIVDVRLSRNENSDTSEEDVKEFALALQRSAGKNFLCFGQKSLAKVLVDHLKRMGVSLSVAESCTGGLLASTLTDVPGVSTVFKGGIVCYSNEIKINMLSVPSEVIDEYGAVSKECALALANECASLYKTDYALSITGYAGPDGGTAEDPVGTVYIGYYSPEGTWAYRIQNSGSREFIKTKAVYLALNWMRKKLLPTNIQSVWKETLHPFPTHSK